MLAVWLCCRDGNDGPSSIGWIAVKFGAEILIPLRMNCNKFGGPLAFHLALCGTLIYEQIPAKIMTFPSASTVLCVWC